MYKLSRRPKPVVLEDYTPDHYYPRHFSRRGGCRLWLGLLLFVTITASSLFWHSAHAMEVQARVDGGWRLEDVGAGQLMFSTDQPGIFQSSVLLHSEVHFQVNGLVAHASLSQSFRNDSDDWAEGIYVFPLEDDAAVNRLVITIGERVIEGVIREKKQARKLYQSAKATGRKAGLIEQQRPNMFTSSVANIPPGETIVVHLEWIQPVRYDNGRFSLNFPMTITPRYIPGRRLAQAAEKAPTDMAGEFFEQQLQFQPGMGWAFNTDQVIDAAQISPPIYPPAAAAKVPLNPIKITADIDMGMPLSRIESAYHSIDTSKEDKRYRLRLSESVVSMEQDFALSWQVVSGRDPAAAIFSETLDGEEHALIMLLPPSVDVAESSFAREVIYIIDSSGSMDGVSIRQARQSLLLALDQLRPGDRFNIIEFNSKTYPLYPQAVNASPANIHTARSYVSRLSSGGGTEMLPALQLALRDQPPANFIRQVIFITDGAVGNEQALFQTIQQQLGNSRLFTVAIGSAPNSYFMRKAAQFGRGSFTRIGQVDEVQNKMTALFSKLDSPLLSNISVKWPDGFTVESYPQKMPDLYRGEPLLIRARYHRSGQVDEMTRSVAKVIKISGQTMGQHWLQHLELNSNAQKKGVAALWAREKISRLLDQKVSGVTEQEIKPQVLAVALTHQLVSPYTSFVAIEKQPSRPLSTVLKTSAVPNVRPNGQGPQAIAYPQTATRGSQSLLLGLAFLIFACSLIYCIHREQQYELVG